MATLTAQVAATTTPSDWNLAAGASKVAAVTQPDDDLTTYLNSTTTNNTVQTFTVTPALSVGDTITQIVLTARLSRDTQNTNVTIGYSFTPNGGGTQTGTSGTIQAVNTWTDYTYTHSGLSVVWGSAMTIFIQNTQARDARITSFYVTITYTPAAGGSGQPPRTLHQVRMRINA